MEREDGEARGERNEVNGEGTAKAERATIQLQLQANRTRERASRIEHGALEHWSMGAWEHRA